jgi:hypothetical protein
LFSGIAFFAPGGTQASGVPALTLIVSMNSTPEACVPPVFVIFRSSTNLKSLF